MDTSPAATASNVQPDGIQEDVLIAPITPIAPIMQYITCPNEQQSVQTSCTPAPYCRGPAPAPYCEEDTPPPDSGPSHPELTSVPGMDYSMILNPTPVAPPTQGFYTCVNSMTPAGELHLVPYLQFIEGADDEADKSSQLAALLEKQMEALLSATESDPSEAGMPLLPHSSDRSCRSI